jgi:hypothetical protein
MGFRGRKQQQKPARPVGAMADKREETQTTYMRVLLKAGLIDGEMLAPGAWSIWQLVNDDPVILEKKAKLPKIHQRTGFLSKYAETATVLDQMTPVERLRLKARVICAEPKYF